MAKIIAEEQPDLPVLPDDSILFLQIAETNIEEKQGRNGPWQKIEFKFKILGIQAVGDGGDPSAYDSLVTEHIWGSIPFRLTDHPENKLKLWSEAILGVSVGVDFELDTDYFPGRQVRGVVSTFEKTRAGVNPLTGQPFRGHQIQALLPAQGAVPAQQPQQQGFSFANPPQPMQQQQAPVQDPWGAPQQQPVQDPWATQQQPVQTQPQRLVEEPGF